MLHSMSGQFLKDEYRHLRNRDYLGFIALPQSVTWRLLRMRIWRPKTGVTVVPKGHLLANLHNDGWLAAACSLDQLVSDWQGMRGRSSIDRDIQWMVERRIVQHYPAPRDRSRPSIFILGDWQRVRDRDGAWHTVELLHVARLWDGAEAEPEPWAGEDDSSAVAKDDPIQELFRGQ